jgi:hypothetical protein
LTLPPVVAERSLIRASAWTAVCLGTVLFASPLWAADLFSVLPGNWVGTGRVTKQDGSTEPLRCKAKYSLTPSGNIMHQELKCAADSYRMDLTADLVNQKGALEGTWHEQDRQVGGSVVGRIEGDTITTKIQGNTFRADVTILTKANKQTIALTSDSGNYAKAVNVDLHAE